MRYFIEPASDHLNPKNPCGSCGRNVSKHFKAIKCDICNYWNHIKCDEITAYTYDKMIELPQSEREKIIHFCKICKESCIPFQKLSEEEFLTSIIKNIEYREDLNLRTHPPEGLKRLFTDFSNHNEDDPIAINCDYYDATTRIPNANKKHRSMIHINIASLGLHKEELEAAISLSGLDFDIIAISETKIMKNVNPTYDTTLSGYKEPYHTPTESQKGGVMIYVKEDIEVKHRPDLESKLYESKNLESVFIEVLNDKNKNEIYGCIYKHPNIDLSMRNISMM